MARGEESLSEKLLSVAPNATSSIAKYYRDTRSFYKSKPTLLLGKTLIKFSFESFFVGDKNKIVHVIKLNMPPKRPQIMIIQFKWPTWIILGILGVKKVNNRLSAGVN